MHTILEVQHIGSGCRRLLVEVRGRLFFLSGEELPKSAAPGALLAEYRSTDPVADAVALAACRGRGPVFAE